MAGPGAAAPTALAMAAAVVSRGGPYLALLIAARLLPPEAFGAYALAGVAANLLGALVSGGGSLWTNRYAAAPGRAAAWRDGVRQRYLQISLAIATAVLAAGAVALIVAPAPWQALILATAAAAIATGLTEAVFSLLRSAGGVTVFFLGRDLALPAAHLALLLLLQPDSAAAAIALLPLAALLPLLAGLLWLKRLGLLSTARAACCSGARLLKLCAYTAGLIANNLAGRLAAYLDVIVLGAVVSAAALGPYRAAAQLALGFAVVQNAVFLGLPWQLRQQGDPAERARRAAQLQARQRLLGAAGAVALLAVLVFAPQILAFFGPNFVELAGLLRLLCAIRFLDLMWGPQQQLLISNGLAGKDSAAAVLAMVVWLAAFAVHQSFLAPLAAAAAAQAMAAPTAQLMRWQALRRAGLVPPLERPIGLNALALCYAGALIMSYLTQG